MSKSKTNMITLFANLKRRTCSYLDNQSFSAFLKTNKAHSRLCDSTPIISQRKASKLLFYVLNINVERKKQILELISLESKTQSEESKAQSETQSIILMRATAEEFFYNTTQRKKLWTNVSPIEAAAKCGDFHLVRLMFDSLPDRQKMQALEQLKAVRASRKILAEAGSYITGLVELRNAYNAYLEPYDALVAAENWNELNKLCGLLGDAHRNLPAFLLQVFCNPVPHHPLPDFTKEPLRACVLWGGAALDISSIGGSTFCALYKGRAAPSAWVCVARRGPMLWAAGVDSAAIDSLYKVLPSELDKIIDTPVHESDEASDHLKRRRLDHSV